MWALILSNSNPGLIFQISQDPNPNESIKILRQKDNTYILLKKQHQINNDNHFHKMWSSWSLPLHIILWLRGHLFFFDIMIKVFVSAYVLDHFKKFQPREGCPTLQFWRFSQQKRWKKLHCFVPMLHKNNMGLPRMIKYHFGE